MFTRGARYFTICFLAIPCLVSGCKHPLEKLSADEHAYEVTYNPYETSFGENGMNACRSITLISTVMSGIFGAVFVQPFSLRLR